MKLLTAFLAVSIAACAEDVKLETPTGTLYGTLEFPSGTGPFPIAILHSGSGPTDRDGNSPIVQGKNNSLKMLAEALASRGVATLRYDKRGIGQSAKAGPAEADLRFSTYIDDLVAWGKMIRADKRFSKLVLVGHSEGALIATVAAGKLPADALVSISGAGKPLDQVILEQMSDRAPPEIRKANAEIVASLKAGRRVETVPEPLMTLFRPSVQPYVISMFQYDPAKEIAKLKMPVLILQGTTDIQVSVTDAKLLAAAKPQAKLVLVEGMNHILKEVGTNVGQQLASYGNPDLPVMLPVIQEILVLVEKLK